MIAAWQETEEHRKGALPDGGAVVARLEGVSKNFGEVHDLRNVDLKRGARRISMKTHQGQSAGWILAVVAFLLLLALNELGWLAIVLPISLLVAYGSVLLDRTKTQLTLGPKKR